MLNREQKGKILKDLKQDIKDAKAIYFADFSGLPVSQATALRKNLKAQDTKAQVVKKTLADIALRDSGLVDSSVKKESGSLLVLFAQNDPLSAAKVLWQFAAKSSDKLKIVGGVLDSKFLAKEDVVALAKMPSREVLLGRLVGAISSPIRNFLWVWQGNINKLVYVLEAIQKSKS